MEFLNLLRFNSRVKIKNNSSIQVLRAVLCLCIMIYHYTCRYSELYHNPNFYYVFTRHLCDIALCSFFLYSGFFFYKPIYGAMYNSYILFGKTVEPYLKSWEKKKILLSKFIIFKI